MSIPKNNPMAGRSLAELKIRSRILLKAANQKKSKALKILSRSGQAEPPFQHKDGLKAVSRLAGFKNWQHAHHVLSGSAQIGDDMGELWYSPKCQGLLNIWCRNYDEARDHLDNHENCFLFPYKTQFVIANDSYAKALGLEISHKLLKEEVRDLVGIYGSPEWDNLTFLRLLEAMDGPSD